MSTSLIDTLSGVAAPSLPQPVAPVGDKVEQSGILTTEVRVVLYNALADPQASEFLPWMWKRMQDDDLVDYYFPGQKDTGFGAFVRLFSGDANVALFLIEKESDKWEDRIPGFITWSSSRMGASDVLIAGFIFFRKFWDHHTTDEAGKAAWKFWFDTTPAQVILGVCPSLHHAAIRYNKRVGLKECGRISGAHLFKGTPCDALLFEMTREQWKGTRES